MNPIIKWLFQILFVWLVQAAALLLGAWRLDCRWAWVYLIGYAAIVAFIAIVLLLRNKDLIARRAEVKPTAERWDRIVGGAYGILTLATLFVAGLDARFGWTPPIAIWRHILGLVLWVPGFGFFTWAMTSNPFFSTVVTVQPEAGHTVATTGPYRYMRHPGYAESTLTLASTPIMLGTFWAFIPMLLAFIALWIRTALEDRTLMAKLSGYAEYAAKTKYRLMPGIW